MNLKLKIGGIYTEKEGHKVRVCAPVEINETGKKENIWFEVDEQYEPYLVTERADAFLVSLLPYAMVNGCDIRIEGPISRKLYEQLENVLIPTVCKNISYFHPIKIDAPYDDCNFRGKGTGTSVSGGVDSFYTIFSNLENQNPYVSGLTHLTLCNNGAHGQYGGIRTRKSFYDNVKKAEKICKEIGLPLLAMDSNISESFKCERGQSVTFRSIGCILAMQKLFAMYHYSSGFEYSDFTFDETDNSVFDLFSLQYLSTESTVLYSSGGEKSRLEKLKYIVDNPIVQKNLLVCHSTLFLNNEGRYNKYNNRNCSLYCDKCIRTSLELFVLGKLEEYGNVFDVERFKKNMDYYIGYLLYCMAAGKEQSFLPEVYKQLKSSGYKFSKNACWHGVKHALSQNKRLQSIRKRYRWFLP